MRVLFVASELYPLIKTGGLADVAGALPPALADRGIEVRCLIPGYPAVLGQLQDARRVGSALELSGSEGRLLLGHAAGIELVALDAPALFDRPGNPYLGPDRRDWPDNHRRFAALAAAAVRIVDGALPGFAPDLVHAHDWQAGLVPALLAIRGGRRPATVMTVHNLAYQGLFPRHALAEIGLPESSFRTEGVEYWGQIGFLKAGLYYADHLTTVSPTYAREIQEPANGLGLEGLLATRAADLTGILNGIDRTVWDPAADPHLPAPYDAREPDGKAVSKVALQRRFGLEERSDALLVGVVSRLIPEKGLDLLLAVLPDLVTGGGQLALLGSGSDQLEQAFLRAAAAAPAQIGVRVGYDEPLAHLIQGGADVIAVPSRMEPCGLTQMYGLRYGTLPLVAGVGGLFDSVIDANMAALDDGVATGFVFRPVDAGALRIALRRALELHAAPEAWRRVQGRAMSRDFGWKRSAERYAELYARLLGRRTSG